MNVFEPNRLHSARCQSCAMSLLIGVFTLIGSSIFICIVVHTLWILILGARAHLVSTLKQFSTDLTKKFGTWAVVTGSTDGIGKAYAKELAKRGVNIVLISRNEDKLAKVAAEIEEKYEVKTKIIVADFSKGQSVFLKIQNELENIPVAILVNNVGKQYSYPMYLGEVPLQELWDIVNINIGATTVMTRMILPQMLKRKKGAIVNISSSSELQPLPLMTVYAASKVFVKSFSDALRVEYQGDGITVQHLSPLFVNTKMNAFTHRLQESSLFVPDAETYAQNAVNTLGHVNHSTGYWAHGVQYFFTVIPPIWVRTYIGGLMNQVFRRDYLISKNIKVTVP